MRARRRALLIGTAVAVLVAGVVAVVVDSRRDGDEQSVTLRSDGGTTSTLEPTTTTALETTTVPETTTTTAVPTTVAPATTVARVAPTTTLPPVASGPPVIEANATDIAARGVYVATLDGKLRHIGDATQIGLDVSPDGRRVVLLNDHRLYVVGVDGQGLREINGVGRVINKWDNPAWSPDGRSVAAIRLDPDGGYRVVVAGVDGGAPRVVGAELTGVAALEWSPDGARIVVASGNAIWSVPVAGGAATKLADTGSYGSSFVEFSPDGTKLAYAIYDALMVMAPDGSQARKVASVPYGGYFAWSPDSTRLVHPTKAEPSSGLAVSAADGTTTTTIVPQFGGPPRWSTSDLIAFTTQEGDRTHIDVVRPDGTDRRRFVTDVAPSKTRGDHVWDPTGAWIAFTSGTGGDGT